MQNISVRKIFKSLQEFHKNEDGGVGLQELIFLALAAMLAVALLKFGKDIMNFLHETWIKITKG